MLLQSNIYGNKFENPSFCKQKWQQAPETLFIRTFSCLLNVLIILKLNAEQASDETVLAHIPNFKQMLHNFFCDRCPIHTLLLTSWHVLTSLLWNLSYCWTNIICWQASYIKATWKNVLQWGYTLETALFHCQHLLMCENGPSSHSIQIGCLKSVK